MRITGSPFFMGRNCVGRLRQSLFPLDFPLNGNQGHFSSLTDYCSLPESSSERGYRVSVDSRLISPREGCKNDPGKSGAQGAISRNRKNTEQIRYASNFRTKPVGNGYQLNWLKLSIKSLEGPNICLCTVFELCDFENYSCP